MRTTVEISDHLLIEAKKLAAEQRSSLRALVEEGLRLVITQNRLPRSGKRREPDLPVCNAGKPWPGIALDDTSTLLDLE